MGIRKQNRWKTKLISMLKFSLLFWKQPDDIFQIGSSVAEKRFQGCNELSETSHTVILIKYHFSSSSSASAKLFKLSPQFYIEWWPHFCSWVEEEISTTEWTFERCIIDCQVEQVNKALYSTSMKKETISRSKLRGFVHAEQERCVSERIAGRSSIR